MADYQPPNETVPTFNSSLFSSSNVGLTTGDLDLLYLKYPISQSSETISGALTVTGNTDIESNLNMGGTAGVNFIQFPDGTQQFTASKTTGNGGISVSTYKTSQTVIPPIGTYKIDVSIIGSGGFAGQTIYNTANGKYGWGGGGAGGNMAVGNGIKWKDLPITITFNTDNVVVNFPVENDQVVPNQDAIVYFGGNGGLLTDLVSNGFPSANANVLPPITTWTSFFGDVGQAGAYNVSNIPRTGNVGGDILYTSIFGGEPGGGQWYGEGYGGAYPASAYQPGEVTIVWYTISSV